MKKIWFFVVAVITTVTVFSSLTACNDGETYAEMKEKERDAIRAFIKDNDVCGPIKVISESTFYAQDSTTNVDENEFVLFNDDGIYMQIVRKGEGETVEEMARQDADSTVNFRVLCRFLEYDIEGADTTRTNYYSQSIVDKLQCTYSQRGRSYTGKFEEGLMNSVYGVVVPDGWLKPLAFIRLTRQPDPRSAKVRVIVPHMSGTSKAGDYVLPYYYEISYQLGR